MAHPKHAQERYNAGGGKKTAGAGGGAGLGAKGGGKYKPGKYQVLKYIAGTNQVYT